MIWLTLVFLWLGSGVFVLASDIYSMWKSGVDVTLKHMMHVFPCMLLGPFVFWSYLDDSLHLMAKLRKAGSVVVVRGKREVV